MAGRALRCTATCAAARLYGHFVYLGRPRARAGESRAMPMSLSAPFRRGARRTSLERVIHERFPHKEPSALSVVAIALKRPYTFIVMAMLIVLATPFALRNMATDIFPEINIPVISIIWSYNGLSAQEMGQRIAGQSERGLTTTVNDIEHIESTSLPGITVIKVFFQQNANIQTAIAQVVAADAGRRCASCRRHHAAPGDQVLGLFHPGGAAGGVQPHPAGKRGVRRHGQPVAPAAGHGAGRGDPLSLRRQDPVISVDLDMPAPCSRAACRRPTWSNQRAEPDPPSGTANLGEKEYSVRMNASPTPSWA